MQDSGTPDKSITMTTTTTTTTTSKSKTFQGKNFFKISSFENEFSSEEDTWVYNKPSTPTTATTTPAKSSSSIVSDRSVGLSERRSQNDFSPNAMSKVTTTDDVKDDISSKGHFIHDICPDDMLAVCATVGIVLVCLCTTGLSAVLYTAFQVKTYRLYHRFTLMKQDDFWVTFDHFCEPNVIFWGSWGSIEKMAWA